MPLTADLRTVRRDLELATYLTERHGAPHNLCASECEPTRLAELLSLADEADTRSWADQALGYTDPKGDPALCAAVAARYTALSTQDLALFGGAQEAIFATVNTLLAAGDRAIVVVPGYQSAETLFAQHARLFDFETPEAGVVCFRATRGRTGWTGLRRACCSRRACCWRRVACSAPSLRTYRWTGSASGSGG